MSDPRTSNPAPVLLCPGQGAQHVGMGRSWYDAHPVAAQTFAAASDALDIDIARLAFEGPEETLNRTDRAQVAIYVSSVACYQALIESERIPMPAATAGLSLGEFTALHLAGAFDFLTGLKLVRLRGEAMQAAAEARDSGMVALVGPGEEEARALCDSIRETLEADEVLVPANFNCPGQVVVSGTRAACERVTAAAEEAGYRATPLAVAGAFHSPVMTPAAEKLATALEEANWYEPTIPVLSNVTGEPHEPDPAAIRQKLIRQLTEPVRWADCMQWLINHERERPFLELAPGKVLAGLARRIERKFKVQSFPHPPDSE